MLSSPCDKLGLSEILARIASREVLHAAHTGRHRQQEQTPAVREEFIAMTYVKVCVRDGWHMTVPRVIHEAVRVDRA
jgi:hypothetical protein